MRAAREIGPTPGTTSRRERLRRINMLMNVQIVLSVLSLAITLASLGEILIMRGEVAATTAWLRAESSRTGRLEGTPR